MILVQRAREVLLRLQVTSIFSRWTKEARKYRLSYHRCTVLCSCAKLATRGGDGGGKNINNKTSLADHDVLRLSPEFSLHRLWFVG